MFQSTFGSHSSFEKYGRKSKCEQFLETMKRWTGSFRGANWKH